MAKGIAMIENDKRAREAIADIEERIVPQLKALYFACKKEGFSADEAMCLVTEWMNMVA